MNPIETKNLSKSYGGTEVLHGLTLTVAQGRLVGFLGPNGAGKTTTIRILMGLIRATAGDAALLGRSAYWRGYQSRSEVGYLPGEVRFYPGMTGRATLNFLAAARRRNCEAEIRRLSEKFDLELRKTVRTYSSGMKQKLGLIQALMHRPQILILDEPTNGLDPLIRKSIFDELRQVVIEGRTVLFSSHTLSEVEELCDDVIILRDGHLIERATISELKSQALRRVVIEFSSRGDVPADFPPQFKRLKSLERTIVGTWSGLAEGLLSWLMDQKVSDVTIEKPNLEDLFMTYYTNEQESNAVRRDQS